MNTPTHSAAGERDSTSSGRSRWWFCCFLMSVVLGSFLFAVDESFWSSQSLLQHHITTTTDTNSDIGSVVSKEPSSGDAATIATTTRTANGKESAGSSSSSTTTPLQNNDSDELQQLQQKLRPRPLLLLNATQVVKNQFLHLHHMKTGGTSMDGLIQCGMQRMHQLAPQLQLSYSNIHECSAAHYQQCIAGSSSRDDANARRCAQVVQEAGILSYCAPLRDLPRAFGWNVSSTHNVPAAITVLRHPVARVWSMFRFQTKSCYQCRPLIQVYQEIDAGIHSTSNLSEICKMQLLNHQTRNLLMPNGDNDEPKIDYPDSEEHATAAIRNLQDLFTMVGLTDDMASTAQMVQHVFPWLAETLDWDTAILLQQTGTSSDTNTTTTPQQQSTLKCTMGHRNASPENNRCGKDGLSHWALPDTPDEATTQAILAHNQVDMKVYEAALQLFERQKRALGIA